MMLTNVSFSQESLEIKYPFILYSERGKEWVYTPAQTDNIIKKIKAEKELVEKLKIGAERRDSLIQEYHFNNVKLKNIIEEKDQQLSAVENKYNVADISYKHEIALRHDMEKELQKEIRKQKNWKNFYKFVIPAAGLTALFLLK